VAEVLAAAAEATDQAPVVPRANLRLLADAGLYDLLDLVPAVAREVHETLAGACGVTSFVWEQHHSPVRMLAAARDADDPTLARLRSGELLAGIAFAYLRRPDPPAVVARAVPGGGLVVDGEAPWVTSWGLADRFAVAARVGGDVVYFLLDGVSPPSPGVVASDPLALAAMNASSTVRLRLDGVAVPDDDVISVQSYETWRAADRLTAARPRPPVFGVARTCCRLLGDPTLAAELDDCRSHAYALLDEERTDHEHLAALTAARAWSCELAVRAATALVVAGGGRSILRSQPAQRLLREAAFFTIQAQTADLRAATLARLRPSVQNRRL
jgi:alkylation response protein AidB-like acyl-CoA dehydrogenase